MTTWAQKNMYTHGKRKNTVIYYVFERPRCENIVIYYVFERPDMLLFNAVHENTAIYYVFHTFTM